MQHERRVHPRATVRLPAKFRLSAADTWTDALLHDLSSGGAGVLAQSTVSMHSEIELRFSIPDDTSEDEIRLHGLVVRTSTPPGDSPGFRCVLGIHFLDLQGSALERVRVHVWNTLHPGPV